MDTFFYILLCTGIASVISQSCEEAHYKRCLDQVQRFTGKYDLIFAETVDELEKECVQAQSALSCLLRYSRKCLPLEEREEFMSSISGPQQVTIGICTQEENLKQRYLSTLPCLLTISNKLEYCKEKFERNQKDISIFEYEDKMHLTCCNYEGYRNCLGLLAHVHSNCSEEMGDVLDEIAVRMGGSFFSDICADRLELCKGFAHRTKASLFLTFSAALYLAYMSVRNVY